MFDGFIIREIERVIEALTSLFTDSVGDGLRRALDALFSAPAPDFTAEWFIAIYSLVFGLAVILAVPMVAIQLLMAVFPGGDPGYFRRALATLGYTFIGGMFLPLIFMFAVMLSDAVTGAMLLIPGTGSDVSTLEQSFGFGGAFGGIDGAAMALISWLAVGILSLSATVASLSAYFSLILGVLSLSVSQVGRMGETFVRWAVAIGFVAVLSRPTMALVIAFAVVMTEFIESQASFMPFMSVVRIIALFAAATIPFVLFIVYQTKLSRVVGGFIRVEGNVDTNSRNSLPARAAIGTANGAGYLIANSDRLRTARETGSAERWQGAQRVASLGATRLLSRSHPVAAATVQLAGTGAGAMARRAQQRETQSAAPPATPPPRTQETPRKDQP